jgi:hypothetical protein
MALIEEKIDKYLTEASTISLEELEEDPDLMRFIKKIPNYEKQVYFSGIHGFIATFNSIYGDKHRFDPTDLVKLLREKRIRWIDVSAIGFEA